MQSGSPSRSLIRKNNAELSVRRQCELLGTSHSSLYTKPAAPDEEKRQLREALMARLDYWHTMLSALGSRKLTVKLQEEGYRVGRKLVRRLMREMGIWVVYPKPNLSKRNFQEATVAYLLRNKVVSFPNQVWSIDITYIKLNRSHMYLTAIIDWCSRKIVGWNLSDTLGLQPVLEAIRSAVDRFGTPSILNSDQGSQFTSNEYKQLLKGLHIRQSMDGKSRWADNIMIERWFRSLKTELIYINEFRSPRELRQSIRSYIDDYNRLRPHEALDYATPDAVYYASFRVA